MVENATHIIIDNAVILIIALYGALISTFVFLWDIYKWKNSGPKIIGSIQSNMIGFNTPEYGNDNLVLVNISNIGDKPTTITNLSLSYFKSHLLKLFKKPKKNMCIGNPSPSQPIPYILKPGSQWSGVFRQTDDILNFAKDGILVCSVHCSHTKKYINFRIKINKVM